MRFVRRQRGKRAEVRTNSPSYSGSLGSRPPVHSTSTTMIDIKYGSLSNVPSFERDGGERRNVVRLESRDGERHGRTTPPFHIGIVSDGGEERREENIRFLMSPLANFRGKNFSTQCHICLSLPVKLKACSLYGLKPHESHEYFTQGSEGRGAAQWSL